MRTIGAITSFCVVCFVIVSFHAHADMPEVFQIITRCPGHSETLTGFRVQGMPGIVTALHGVAGCEKISAIGGGTTNGFGGLRIIQADIRRDIALLSSPELEASPDGLQVTEQESDYGGLYVVGYPLGITEQLVSKDLAVRERPRRPLYSLIPSNLYQTLNDRNSPNVKTEVLSLEGHLLHGHSGAPVLNGQHQVVGIANGGLEDGATAIVWAIPWQDIVWESASAIQDELVRLTEFAKPVSFSSSASGDRRSLKIAFKGTGDVTHTIQREVYANRATQYLLPIPQEMNVEEITHCLILDADDVVLAQGRLNTRLSSTDGLYEFTVSEQTGVFTLRVTPVLVANPVYNVRLMLSSRMRDAEIFVDGEPAMIVDQAGMIVTIRVEGKDSAHQILIKKGNRCCRANRLIRQNGETLRPCVSTSACE